MTEFGNADAMRDDNGKLPAYAAVGCYQIVYLTRDNSTLCVDCAQRALDNPEDYNPPVNGDVYWEGDPLECEDCGKLIESEYGPVEDEQA